MALTNIRASMYGMYGANTHSSSNITRTPQSLDAHRIRFIITRHSIPGQELKRLIKTPTHAFNGRRVQIAWFVSIGFGLLYTISKA